MTKKAQNSDGADQPKKEPMPPAIAAMLEHDKKAEQDLLKTVEAEKEHVEAFLEAMKAEGEEALQALLPTDEQILETQQHLDTMLASDKASLGIRDDVLPESTSEEEKSPDKDNS